MRRIKTLMLLVVLVGAFFTFFSAAANAQSTEDPAGAMIRVNGDATIALCAFAMSQDEAQSAQSLMNRSQLGK